MAEDKIKVLPVRRFNVVQLIFFILLIYMVIIMAKYISKEDIKITEVTEGSLTQNHTYSGLILRTEELLYADSDGYLKCYIGDGQRVSKDTVVFAVDKTGESLSASNSTKKEISADEYKTIRKYLNHFVTGYDSQRFDSVYNFKNQLLTVLYSIEQQDAALDENSGLSLIAADKSGLIYYNLDGFEGKKAEDVTRKALENLSYRSTHAGSRDEVTKGQKIAKLISEESWQIVIPITSDDAAYYKDQKKANIYLNDIKISLRVNIEILTDKDGGKTAVLTLDKYMSSFSSDRIVSVTLQKDLVTGLKVPNTSIVSNDLYKIPIELATKDENDKVSFYKVTTKGEEKTYTAVSPDISFSDDNWYYIDDPQISPGDIICTVDEENGNIIEESFTVGEKKTLQGVYNVNKGYAVFEVVDVLEADDAYSIVKGGTKYGLSVFDHIVLNAAAVSEDDLIY